MKRFKIGNVRKKKDCPKWINKLRKGGFLKYLGNTGITDVWGFKHSPTDTGIQYLYDGDVLIKTSKGEIGIIPEFFSYDGFTNYQICPEVINTDYFWQDDDGNLIKEAKV